MKVRRTSVASRYCAIGTPMNRYIALAWMLAEHRVYCSRAHRISQRHRVRHADHASRISDGQVTVFSRVSVSAQERFPLS